jgi:DNA (cytosine-5)-methyltransferase 1
VTWKVIDSSQHGIAQRRKRIYIVGTRIDAPDLENFPIEKVTLSSVLERNAQRSLRIETDFARRLLEILPAKSLYGKQIKDKRGGRNNIHSWDLELKGTLGPIQKVLIESLMRQRRRKVWAEERGLRWKDGMPLTLSQIVRFAKESADLNQLNTGQLSSHLVDLASKGYLSMTPPGGLSDHTEFNIVAGKLSFEISNILDPNSVAPTLVATDANRLAVVDGNHIRRLSKREGLRLFGFPENYNFPNSITSAQVFDLLGNSVCVSTVKMVAERMIRAASL